MTKFTMPDEGECAAVNTDREIWSEGVRDFYAATISVTEGYQERTKP